MSVLRAALSEEDPDPAVHQALQRTFPLPAGRLEDPARVSEAHRVFRQSVFVYRLRSCEKHCPQSLKISQHMKEIAQKLEP